MTKAKKAQTVRGIRVTAKQDGFRRGGRAWSGTVELTEQELEQQFDEEQLVAIANEPLLVVEEIEIELADEASPDGDDK